MFKYDFVFATLSAFTIAALSAAPGQAQAQAQDQAADNAGQAAATCEVTRLTSMRTDFPQVSQTRGEHGDVLVKVTIDKDGRAARTQVVQSSGYPALDKAATESIAARWRFDVSRCAVATLPTDSLVTVQFQRAPHYSASTVDTRRTASPAQDSATTHCQTTTNAVGDQIVACHLSAPLVNSNVQPSLANRGDSAAGK